MKCTDNKWNKYIFSILFQVILIFTFLTIFFFVYVVKVEKEQFIGQINLIVDDLLTKDVQDDLINIIPLDKRNGDFYKNLPILLSGIIDLVEEKSIRDGEDSVDYVVKENKKTKNKAFKYLIISLVSLIILTIVMIVIGYCIPVTYQIKEGLWVVLFVALTEFSFLTIIASKYISADTNKIKRIFASSVKKAINKPKKE
jgi:hypothetical protein